MDSVFIEQLGNLGELLAALATLATLVYLARQIRQSNQIARWEAHRSSVVAYADVTGRIFSDADTASIFRNGLLELAIGGGTGNTALNVVEIVETDSVPSAISVNFERSSSTHSTVLSTHPGWLRSTTSSAPSGLSANDVGGSTEANNRATPSRMRRAPAFQS